MTERFSRRRLIRTVYLPTLLHAGGNGMLGPAIPLFASQLDVPFALIGLLASVQGVGQMLADVPTGLLVAHVGGRRAMAIGVCASAGGALALALSQTPLQLFLAVPLVGVGFAMWATARLAYMAEVAPVEQRGRALALLGGASRVGTTAGPILGGLLSEAYGIQAAFLGHACLALLALGLMLTQRAAPHVREEDDGIPERAHLRVVRTLVDYRRDFATAGSVAISLAMLRTARRVLIPLWGVWLDLDLAQIGLVIGLASAVDMTLFYPVGVVMDRWGRKWTIVPALLTLSLSLALVPLSTGFATFLAAALLGGLGNGFSSGAIMTMGADLAPVRRMGEFLGVWRVISDSGAVFGPALVGTLAQVLTLGTAFVSASAIGVAGAFVMIFAMRDGLKQLDPGGDGGG